jgi:acetyl-CoA acetyltransferase
MPIDLFASREVVIAGLAELPRRRRSGASPGELVGAVMAELFAATGLAPRDIDGLAVTVAMAEAAHPFWSNALADLLGLSPRWLQVTDLGGASAVANVVRAAMAIQCGQCETVLCLGADAPSTRVTGVQSGFKTEFSEPQGYAGPLAAFGLISSVYTHRYGDLSPGLARLAVAQREGALANPLGVPELRKPLTEADYLASRMVAAPLRMLDCVMPCDGAYALLVTSAPRARALGCAHPVVPIGYAEITNPQADEPLPDILLSGFAEAGPRALAQAGLTAEQIGCFQPYDDFLIAVALQLEQIGFCPTGGAREFLTTNDLGPRGRLPINTGGGQVSSGQPGLANGGVNLLEAVRQLRHEAGARQVPGVATAMVTGIGAIQYVRNWGTSNVLVLAR